MLGMETPCAVQGCGNDALDAYAKGFDSGGCFLVNADTLVFQVKLCRTHTKQLLQSREYCAVWSANKGHFIKRHRGYR